MEVLSEEITEEEREALRERNVSDSIRYLDQKGYARADIARIIKRRYQHIRNVLIATKNRQEGRKKVTFTVIGDVYREFETQIKDLGQNRDDFLEGILPAALDSLADAPANSEETRQIVEDVFDASSYEDAVQLTVVLAGDQIQRMNELCRAKNLPAELLLDWLISASSDSLGKALELVGDPIGAFLNMGETFCGDYLMTDAAAQDLKESVDNELVLAEAIAGIKGVSVYTAQKSLIPLTAKQKRHLLENSQIQGEISRIEASRSEIVELDDLLG